MAEPFATGTPLQVLGVACETDPLLQTGMRSDVGWQNPAGQNAALYRQLIHFQESP